MTTSRTLLALAVLCCATWAGQDAALAPEQGVALVPAGQQVMAGVDAVSIPRMLSYQGRLTDTLGVPVPDTLYSVRFRLYTQASGGTHFWEENQTVRTGEGLFSTLLGASTPIGSMPDAGTAYLGMAVAGGAEMTPRLRIASAAYSFLSERAANADLLQGRDTVHFDARYVNENQLNSVTGPMLVNGAVTTAKIFDGEVNNADLAPGAVTGDKVNQMSASSGQVLKWTGSTWAPRNDSIGGGGGGGVTSVSQSTGITCTPNPITSTGTVALNTGYSDARYVNVTGDSMSGALAVGAPLRVHDKAALGYSCYNNGFAAFCAGYGNSAGGDRASISGGEDNSAGGQFSHISGGSENQASARWATIGGGNLNEAADTATTVAGGMENYATVRYAAVCGGQGNVATGDWAVVGGGRGNTASDTATTVAGGMTNQATATDATVGGGVLNEASDNGATVGGGIRNNATGRFSTIAGGISNSAEYEGASVGGGVNNHARGSYANISGGLLNTTGGRAAAAIGGGYGNYAGDTSTVAGGSGNRALGVGSAIGGGVSNTADTSYATVGGGDRNDAQGAYSFVGGGRGNSADNIFATVGGGEENRAGGYNAVVAGGYTNSAGGPNAVVGGGTANNADSAAGTVAGGAYNHADGTLAAVGGGFSNYATAYCATVPGGEHSRAGGKWSLAAGRFARARHISSFVWSDSAGLARDSVYSTGSNQFRVRARGGTWFFSNAGMTTGAYLAAGSNSWASVCDSANKTDFRPVDGREVLDRLAGMPVRYYRMKDQDDGTRHIGPVAQDFAAAFGVGETSTAINLSDMDGVTLAAIQALYEDNRQLRQEVEELKARLDVMR